jgi:hypothetical protein
MVSFPFIRGALTGLCSGVLMGLFMKVLEMVSDRKIYVLLLNVDFIPGIIDQNFSELTEFSLHLIVAAVIGIVFGWLVEQFNLFSKKKQLFLSMAMTFPALLLYFPLTYLAAQETPALKDGLAIMLWSVGHLVFALLLPLFYVGCFRILCYFFGNCNFPY